MLVRLWKNEEQPLATFFHDAALSGRKRASQAAKKTLLCIGFFLIGAKGRANRTNIHTKMRRAFAPKPPWHDISGRWY
jgi:hypothetical protein